MSKTPLTLKEAKNMPESMKLRMINKAKKFLIEDKTWKEACSKWDAPVEIINYIPVMFGKLDVSAKTNKGIITLNIKMLTEEDPFKSICEYLIHEASHFLQQCMSDKPTKSSDDESYLHNKHEQEAFTNQVGFIGDHFGKDEAEEYVEDLMEYHDVDDKKVEDKLLSKV